MFMIRRWVKHDGVRVIHGNGIPPLDAGDIYFYGEVEEESSAVVNGILLIQGQPATMGTYTFEMVSGESVIYEVDNSGLVVSINGSSVGDSGSSS
jgi:hypothetical protein